MRAPSEPCEAGPGEAPPPARPGVHETKDRPGRCGRLVERAAQAGGQVPRTFILLNIQSLGRQMVDQPIKTRITSGLISTAGCSITLQLLTSPPLVEGLSA